jgi:hypothetical protein
VTSKTAGQLELPLFEPVFERSTPDNPVPEQVRTHPAQMIIRHCGKPGPHGSHAYDDEGPWGCPGVPDLRDHHTPATVGAWMDANDTVEMPNYYRPMPLANGVIDRCEATRNGIRCAWKGHFGTKHSWSAGRRDKTTPTVDIQLPEEPA